MSQFEDFSGGGAGGGGELMECAVFEMMCPEAVDGTLTASEQRAFEKHVAGCVHCSEELAEAQRGAAWLAMLKGSKPEPPAALLQRILAETTGAAAVWAAAEVGISPMPQTAGHAWGTSSVWDGTRVPAVVAAEPSLWARFTAKMEATFSGGQAGMGFQPRLAMTTAMAFFSVALTLNMMGIRAKDIRNGLTRPATLERTFADASASATRSFQNMRVVYEVESRVSDLRNNSGLDEKLKDEERDPGGPFSSGGSGEKSVPEQTPGQAPGQQDDQPKQVVPQGKSELEYPIRANVAARKGA